MRQFAFASWKFVTYVCLSKRYEPEANMNHSPDTASDSGFPALFVVLSTFVGVLLWLCVMLNSMGQ
jgi:hypothetical protein